MDNEIRVTRRYSIMRKMPAVLTLILGLHATCVAAWNDVGHMAAAEIAYRELRPTPYWDKIVAILKEHPRLVDLRANLPEDVSKEEEWHYIFLKAAVWPDMVR